MIPQETIEKHRMLWEAIVNELKNLDDVPNIIFLKGKLCEILFPENIPSNECWLCNDIPSCYQCPMYYNGHCYLWNKIIRSTSIPEAINLAKQIRDIV